jgi:hypothetical protein
MSANPSLLLNEEYAPSEPLDPNSIQPDAAAFGIRLGATLGEAGFFFVNSSTLRALLA